jgi:hypothetical protein
VTPRRERGHDERLIKWTVYTTPSQRKAIRLLAVERDVDASRLVREALVDFLTKQGRWPPRKAP